MIIISNWTTKKVFSCNHMLQWNFAFVETFFDPYYAYIIYFARLRSSHYGSTISITLESANSFFPFTQDITTLILFSNWNEWPSYWKSHHQFILHFYDYVIYSTSVRSPRNLTLWKQKYIIHTFYNKNWSWLYQ